MNPLAPREEPLLRGPRVTLRLGEVEDIGAIVDFFSENRRHFAPTDPPRPPQFYRKDYWIDRLGAAQIDYQQDRSCHLFVLARPDERTVLGYANLSNFVRGAFHACHLGYGIGEKKQGRGLMTEALRLVIPFAFEQLRLHRIMANYLPTNDRSARVLERIGFVKEGYARDYLFINGSWRDHVLTALVNKSWTPPDESPQANPDHEG